MGVLDNVRQQYPTLAFLLNDPEVGSLLRKAVDPNATYSPGRFQAELMQTRWWRSRSQANRESDILMHTDRATWKENVRNYRAAVRQRAAQLGVGLNGREIEFLAASMFRNGTQPDSPILDSALLGLRNKPGKQREGAVKSNAMAAKQMAKGMYYFKLSEGSAKKWGQELATGTKTQDDLRQYLSEVAVSKYPWLKSQLRQGNTVDEVFSEHKAAIAQTLELDPNQLDLTYGKWRKVMDYHDHKTKRRRMMTVGEAEYLARQDHRYWKTKAGREADAGAASMVLRMFGKRSI